MRQSSEGGEQHHATYTVLSLAMNANSPPLKLVSSERSICWVPRCPEYRDQDERRKCRRDEGG